MIEKQLLILKIGFYAILPGFLFLVASHDIANYLMLVSGPIKTDACHPNSFIALDDGRYYSSVTKLQKFYSYGSWHCPKIIELKHPSSLVVSVSMLIVFIVFQAITVFSLLLLVGNLVSKKKLNVIMTSVALFWRRARQKLKF